MKIIRTGRFELMLDLLVQSDASMKELVRERISLFQKNPEDTRLDTHSLRKRLKGKWAFSITGDIRIVFEWLGTHRVRFLTIGGHNVVYRSRRKMTARLSNFL